MGQKPEHSANYVKNLDASKGRTLRIELIGEVSEAERHFLDGTGFFMAGTFTKEDDNHITYVSQMMGKMVKGIIAKLRGDQGKKEG